MIDRLDVIRKTISKFGEDNFYLSLSGGKDSTILHHLLDEALPGNKIPRVYIDTGIEFLAVKDFVLSIAKNDGRVIIIKPSKPIKATLDKFGYPFKSKSHSHHLDIYQKSGLTLSVMKYLQMLPTKSIYLCPNSLRYQFSLDFKIRCSDRCCFKMKKQPAHKWEKSSGKTIAITGMRREEGGQRKSLKGCIITDSNGKAVKFHPLLVVNDDWEDWYIKKRGINLCSLYYPPFNFKRTGCKGCPFALDLQEQLSIMDLYLPNEREQCEFIWKPVYEEYRRIGYRLDRWEQVRLF